MHHRPIFIAIATSLLLLTEAIAVNANQYGTGHENSANYGMQATRIERAVTCVGTGAGFVFDDQWQGVQDDVGWVEVGTSFCDQGAPAAKWVWARYTPSLGYYESVIQYNITIGTTHTFKIYNYNQGYWGVYIDGTRKVSGNYGAGSTSNTADVGLEVTDSRINSTQNTTSETNLYAWSTQSSASSWSGADSCRDTSSHIYPQWIAYDWWRHTLNVVASQSAC